MKAENWKLPSFSGVVMRVSHLSIQVLTTSSLNDLYLGFLSKLSYDRNQLHKRCIFLEKEFKII